MTMPQKNEIIGNILSANRDQAPDREFIYTLKGNCILVNK
jgi:hypothetical protein